MCDASSDVLSVRSRTESGSKEIAFRAPVYQAQMRIARVGAVWWGGVWEPVAVRGCVWLCEDACCYVWVRLWV